MSSSFVIQGTAPFATFQLTAQRFIGPLIRAR